MSTVTMETAKQRAERVWKVIHEKNLATSTAVCCLEKEIRDAMQEERAEVVKKITTINISFDKIPFLMWFLTIFSVIFSPRKFYSVYFKMLQKNIAKRIENE